MKTNETFRIIHQNSPHHGGIIEWVIAVVENGKVKVSSSPSERTAREALKDHPEGTLYLGHIYLAEVDIKPPTPT